MSQEDLDFDRVRRDEAVWSARENPCVETVSLRPGVALVLSRYPSGPTRTFVFEEPEDFVGFGFHALGGAEFHIAGASLRTHAGACAIGVLRAGVRSRFTFPTTGFRTASVRMSPDAARTLLGAAVPAQSDSLSLGRALEAPEMRMLDNLFATPFVGAARRLHLESGILALLARQLGDQTLRTSPRHHARVVRARDILEARLLDSPSILMLAREVGLNDFTLKRAFKELFGETIFGYVRTRRLERAAAALHEGALVSEAAERAGYACRSRFAAAFRRRYGVTPRAWLGSPLP